MPSQSWYIHIRGETFGPLPTELLTILLRQNRLQFSDWVWNDQLPRWARLEELDPFRTLLPEYPNAPLPTGTPAPVAAPALAPLPQAAPPPPVAAPIAAPAPAAAPAPVAPAPAAGGFQPLPFPPIQRPAAAPMARPAGLAPTFPTAGFAAPAMAAAPAVAAAPAPIPQAAPAPLYVVPPAQAAPPQQPAPAQAAPPQQPPVQAAPVAPPVAVQAAPTPPPPPQEEIHASDPASEQKVWIRRHMRIAIEGFAEVDQFGDFQVYDVSEGGMFVVSKTPIPFGTDVKLKLTCPNMAKPLEMTGIVIREGLSEGGEAGFAIQFTRVNPAHRRAIQDLVRQKLGQS